VFLQRCLALLTRGFANGFLIYKNSLTFLYTEAAQGTIEWQVSPQLTILLANYPQWPRLSDLSWLTPTQECKFREFANSIFQYCARIDLTKENKP